MTKESEEIKDACGHLGKWGDAINKPLTRWGEELGAPRMVTTRLNCFAPVLSRAVDVTLSNGIFGTFYGHNGSGDIRNAQSWHCARNGSKPARTSSIEQSRPRRAEFFAPPRQGL